LLPKRESSHNSLAIYSKTNDIERPIIPTAKHAILQTKRKNA